MVNRNSRFAPEAWERVVVSPRGARYYEPPATLSDWAASTSAIGLLGHVLVLGDHHPLEIVKGDGTLDRISRGRLIAGVGVGSVEAEFELLGKGLGRPAFRARGVVVHRGLVRGRNLPSAMRPEAVARGHDAQMSDDGGERSVSDRVDLTAVLLVASPRLEDPNFIRTVVFILDHGEDGALGVVLNRPTSLDVDEILEPWQDQAELAPPALVFRGGPVSPDAVIGLARSAEAVTSTEAWRSVIGPVGTVDLEVAPDQQPVALAGVRLFAGYAGWAMGQLEAEIDEGGWFVVDALTQDVFSDDPDRLWHDILRRQGGDLGLLATYPLHPSLN